MIMSERIVACLLSFLISTELIHCQFHYPEVMKSAVEDKYFVRKADTNMKQGFVFSVNNKNWRLYNWDKITTIVECGYHDEELLKFAHSRNVTVSYYTNFPDSVLKSAASRSRWVASVINHIKKFDLDGVNVDFESVIKCSEIHKRANLTLAVQELSNSLKRLKPDAQVTIDFPWSTKASNYHCYDFYRLAAAVDFVFIMGYGEHSKTIGRGHCVAWSICPFILTEMGLKQFLKLGITAEKIVIGLPWYGFDYPCRSYKKAGNICHTEAEVDLLENVKCVGKRAGFSYMIDKLNQSFTGRLWDKKSQTPYATYKDRDTGKYHQIWYDDVESLQLKYRLANQLGLLGVGMWEADSLDYSDTPEKRKLVNEMWNALPTPRR